MSLTDKSVLEKADLLIFGAAISQVPKASEFASSEFGEQFADVKINVPEGVIDIGAFSEEEFGDGALMIQRRASAAAAADAANSSASSAPASSSSAAASSSSSHAAAPLPEDANDSADDDDADDAIQVLPAPSPDDALAHSDDEEDAAAERENVAFGVSDNSEASFHAALSSLTIAVA